MSTLSVYFLLFTDEIRAVIAEGQLAVEQVFRLFGIDSVNLSLGLSYGLVSIVGQKRVAGLLPLGALVIYGRDVLLVADRRAQFFFIVFISYPLL